MSAAAEAAGLFGPGSVSWLIDRELVVLAGGSCALLMQAAHPAVAAGVAEHSTYATDAFGRLIRTLESSFDVVFGSRSTAESAIRRVNAIHRSVRGRLADGGRTTRETRRRCSGSTPRWSIPRCGSTGDSSPRCPPRTSRRTTTSRVKWPRCSACPSACCPRPSATFAAGWSVGCATAPSTSRPRRGALLEPCSTRFGRFRASPGMRRTSSPCPPCRPTFAASTASGGQPHASVGSSGWRAPRDGPFRPSRRSFGTRRRRERRIAGLLRCSPRPGSCPACPRVGIPDARDSPPMPRPPARRLR